MRATLVMLLCALAIPIALLSPLLGLMAYCWLSYMRPQEMAWGISHHSFGMYTAVALFVGLLLRGKMVFFKTNRVTLTMFVLWAIWGLTTWTAIDTGAAMQGLRQISVIFLICLVTTGLCTDTKKLRWVLSAIVGSLAFHGVKHGLFGIVNPGASMNEGIGGMMSGNNENAVAFNFVLPLLVYMALAETRKWRRMALFSASGLTALAIVFSHSRAGFLGMVAAGLVMVWRTRARFWSLFVVAPTLVFLMAMVVPDSYHDRIKSIGDAPTNDLSAMHRIEAWKVAAHITSVKPFTGIGPRNFPDQFRRFPHPFELPRMKVHNTYLEFSSSSGIPGLLVYLALVAAAFAAARKVEKDALLRDDPRVRWHMMTARAMQASMAAFMVSSAFGSLMHFDMMYHFCALSACLPVVYAKRVEEITSEDDAVIAELNSSLDPQELADVTHAAVAAAHVVAERVEDGAPASSSPYDERAGAWWSDQAERPATHVAAVPDPEQPREPLEGGRANPSVPDRPWSIDADLRLPDRARAPASTGEKRPARRSKKLSRKTWFDEDDDATYFSAIEVDDAPGDDR